MERNSPIGINSLVHIAPIGPVESIGPIGINSTSGANWAMKPIGPIGINSLGHIAPIGLEEPIGPIGINSLVQIAPIGPVEPIGPIGINSTYCTNWARGTNWPNWHK